LIDNTSHRWRRQSRYQAVRVGGSPEGSRARRVVARLTRVRQIVSMTLSNEIVKPSARRRTADPGMLESRFHARRMHGGVATGWARGGAKSTRPPSAGAPGVPGKQLCTRAKLNRFAEFWAVNCTKMRLAAGLHPDPLARGL